MISRSDFFQKYSIDDQAFRNSGLTWEKLCEIDRAYEGVKPGLESVGKYIVDALLKCSKVHSITYRLKENEHLLEKIIRKTVLDPGRHINSGNFRAEITDLVGIRALHLFKEDWISVHEYISKTWDLAEKPLAYIRSGDPEKLTEYYRKNGCEVKEHRHGYRSVHYIIESTPNKERYLVEIQARTVFEEAWGEIDHVIRYPYDAENELLVRLSSILNRLAANADELGTYMRYLKAKTSFMEQQYSETVREKNQIIEDLKTQISRLKIDKSDKEALNTGLIQLSKNRSEQLAFEEQYPWLEDFFESDLFRGISERISSIVQSDQFKNIELTDADINMLSNAQQDLVRLMQNPDFMKLLEQQFPFENTPLAQQEHIKKLVEQHRGDIPAEKPSQ